jgi:flavin-dependent dehydrogenase
MGAALGVTGADAIVVGAGPAGSAAAIRCLEAGLRAVVLERQPLPRERVGETLHPGVEAPLRALGVLGAVEAAGFVRHGGVWRSNESGVQFGAYGSDAGGPWRGYQAWRPRFDALLAERVRTLGGTILTGRRAQRPLLEDGAVVGVETARGRLRAPVVVDAAGGSHWLARTLGLALERHSPRLVAAYGYAEGAAPRVRHAPLFASTRSGWT